MPGLHFNLACSLLITEQFEEGWKEYQWRFKLPKIKQVFDLLPKLPSWNKESGKVLLFNEQGIGDLIMMLRFLPELQEQYPFTKFTIACSRMTIELVKNCFNIETAMFNADEGIPLTGNWDYMCSMMDLPMMFKHSGKPYLDVKEDILQVNSRFTNLPEYTAVKKMLSNKVNVGISWAGNELHDNDQDRSCFLKEFKELFFSDVNIISLQKGVGKRTWQDKGMIDLAEGKNSLPLIDMTNLVYDFYDMAKMVAGLDLVITVDTAIAHLAGALGIPTWLLVGSYPDFRWLLNKTDTNWYQSIKLFRKSSIDWKPVFTSVKMELDRFVLSKKK
jgi:hypothetical protein